MLFIRTLTLRPKRFLLRFILIKMKINALPVFFLEWRQIVCVCGDHCVVMRWFIAAKSLRGSSYTWPVYLIAVFTLFSLGHVLLVRFVHLGNAVKLLREKRELLRLHLTSEFLWLTQISVNIATWALKNPVTAHILAFYLRGLSQSNITKPLLPFLNHPDLRDFRDNLHGIRHLLHYHIILWVLPEWVHGRYRIEQSIKFNHSPDKRHSRYQW